MNASLPMHAETSKPRVHLPHVPELDGIRGLAALAVFCHHLLFASLSHPEQSTPFVAIAAYLSRAGMYGVDVFFVLSGYLITSILLLDRNSPHFYRNFYWKRALRIFPLYAVTLVLIAIFIPHDRSYVVLSALFIANFSQIFHVLADGPFWTLAIEEQFYLIWPQCAERLTVVFLRRTAVVLAASCLLLRLVAAALGHHDFRFTFFHCDGLALGALLACNRLTKPSSRDGTATGRGFALFTAGVLLSLLAIFVSPISRLGMAAEALQITGVSILGFLAVQYAVEHTGSSGLRLLRSRVLTFFGLISYCLYMSHLYILRLSERYFGPGRANDSLSIGIQFIGVLVATILVCVSSRYVLELPAMSLRRYVLRKP